MVSRCMNWCNEKYSYNSVAIPLAKVICTVPDPLFLQKFNVISLFDKTLINDFILMQ